MLFLGHIRHTSFASLNTLQVSSRALRSKSRYVVPLAMASSKSISWPSNSGPSTQANFVTPPTVRRQPPHMPVPSTMIGFMLATVLIPYCLVRRQTNFIMMRGPMVMTSSYCSPLSMSFFRASVTRPFSPHEPSSLMRTSRVECAANSSSRITRSWLRKPTMACTSVPCS